MSLHGPLDTPEHVLLGWRYVNSYMVILALHQGRLSPAEWSEARDRIWLAAVEHGLIDPADGQTWRLP